MRLLWSAAFLAIGFGNANSRNMMSTDVSLANGMHNKSTDRSSFTFQALSYNQDDNERIFDSKILTELRDAEELGDGVTEETWSGVSVDWITQVSSVMRPLPNDLAPGCRRDTTRYLRELRNFSDWAVRMMDASAKFPHGILMGNLQAMGDFDECLWLEAPDSIKPQYCLANIDLNVKKIHKSYSQLEHVVRTMTYDRIDKEFTKDVGSLSVPKISRIDWAMCIPASCSVPDVESILNEAAKRILPDSDIRVTVDPKDCYTDMPNPSFSARDLMITSAILVVVLLVVVGTLYVEPDPNTNQMKGMPVLSKLSSAFSLRRSWNELTDVSTQRSGQIHCLDGMRALSALWVVIGHQGHFPGNESYSSKITNLNTHKYSIMYLWWNFFLSVDTFLVIGGVVRCYTLLPGLEKQTVNHWKNAVMRFLRLTPALMVIVGFYVAIMDRISTGPTWNRSFATNKIACELNWWKTIFLVNNFHFSGNYLMCASESWYTSIDMQYFLLAPLLIVPLWRKPRIGFALVTATVVIATIVQYATIINNEMTGFPISFQTPVVYELNHMMLYYFAPHTRTVPYLIGIMLGYIMYYYRSVTLSKTQLVLGWILSVVAFTWSLIGAKLVVSVDKNFDHVEHAVFGSIHKSVWAMAMAWLIFACHHEYGGLINRVLCCNILKFVSRISYSLYVSHPIVLHWISGSLRGPAHMDFLSELRRIVSDTSIAIGPAILLYLFVESPFTALSRLLFSKPTRTVKTV